MPPSLYSCITYALQLLTDSVLSFLSRDATLAWYMLLLCLRLSVRYTLVVYRNHWTNQGGFGMGASF